MRLAHLRDWGLLAGIVLLLWPALGMDLEKRDITRIMESNCLVRSQSMWLGMHGAPGAETGLRAWLVASQNGRPTVTKPPMLLWLNQLAWIGLEPGAATPEELVWRARLVSAVMAGLMLGAIYGIGLLLQGRTLGAVAALAAGGMFWFFQRQARTASYDIHLAAWATMAVAAGLWATELGESAPSRARQVGGWVLAGVFLAAGWLTKGPLALVWVGLPLAAIALALPERRVRTLLGLGGAVALAVALVAPWYAYVLWHVGSAEETFLREYRAARQEAQPFFYYVALLGLVFPWTLWLAGGLAVPWLDREPPRQTRWIPWLWFVVGFVFFSIPEAKQQRYILPIVAPAALLIGQLAVYLAGTGSDEAADTPAWLRYLMGAHGWMLVVASVGFGVYLSSYNWLAANHWIAGREMGEFPWRLGALLGVLLVAVALLVLQRVEKRQFVRAAVGTGVWSALLGGVWWSLYDGRPAQDAEFRESARRLVALVGDAPAYSYRPADSRAEYLYINKGFLFYMRRSLPELTLQEVKNKACGDEMFVLSPADGIAEGQLASLGFELLPGEFKGRKQPWRLWHARPAATQPAVAAATQPVARQPAERAELTRSEAAMATATAYETQPTERTNADAGTATEMQAIQPATQADEP